MEVSRCPKCRGFNGSLDLSTNLFRCNDCEYNGLNRKMDWSQYLDEIKDKEKKRNGK